jgi:hypothetical protein
MSSQYQPWNSAMVYGENVQVAVGVKSTPPWGQVLFPEPGLTAVGGLEDPPNSNHFESMHVTCFVHRHCQLDRSIELLQHQPMPGSTVGRTFFVYEDQHVGVECPVGSQETTARNGYAAGA